MILVSSQLQSSMENYPPGSFDNGWWIFKEEMALDLEMNGKVNYSRSELYLFFCRNDNKQK